MDKVVKELKSFYQGKRVFITGHTGFKGSWLAFWLTLLGADVTGYALPPKRQADHFNLLGLSELLHHIEGDIRDGNQLKNAVAEAQPDIVFHLAAQAIVRASYDDPKETFDTNVGGSVNLLEAVRHTSSARSLIYVTSDKCYENKEWIWGYRENDDLGGRDPYSASKAAAEIVFRAYRDSFFNKCETLGAASVRAGNVIGGGDWAADRIVPDIIQSLKKNQPVVLRNPNATRPWQHVLEPLSGYLLLAQRLYKNPDKFSGSWNFGPDGEAVHTVRELTENIFAVWGAGELIVDSPPGMPHEAGLLHLNCDKARHVLGWKPRWDFERTVKETAGWYQSILNGEKASLLTSRQIQSFMNND